MNQIQKRVGWLAAATMKSNGIFSDGGECLCSGRFTPEQCADFNPTVKVAPKKEKKSKKK